MPSRRGVLLPGRLASMPSRPPLDSAVRELIRARAEATAGDLPNDLPLGSCGLGLDSIALVELLMDCEQRFAVERPLDLLEGPPLTVGSLIEHLRAQTGS